MNRKMLIKAFSFHDFCSATYKYLAIAGSALLKTAK